VSDLVMICPSRGRPANVARLAAAWSALSSGVSELVVAVDEDDPELGGYLDVELAMRRSSVTLLTGPRLRMVGTLNDIAVPMAGRCFAVGFLGDDHLPQTAGFDGALVAALREMGTGIVYGNDLLQGERLPTAVAMTSDIVRALGYMAPPGLIHLAVDNAWLELGRGAGCIRYLPDVVLEHIHPFAGKAPLDAGYAEVNAGSMYQRDLAEFARWKREELPSAVSKVRALALAGVDD
jgi:hypothetical protein